MQNDLFFIFASVALYLWALRSILYWVRIWQRSSYRPTLSALAGRARKKLWQYVLSPSSLLTIAGIVVVLVLSVTDQPLIYSQLLILAILFLKAGIALRDILLNKLVRPMLSFRAIAVLVLSFLLLSVLFLFPLTERFLWLLLLDRSIFFLVAFVIAVFTFPNELYDDYQIRKAMKAVRSQAIRSILLIGGEETHEASHSLGQMLSRKFMLLVVDGSPISAAEVASRINSEVSDETEMLIVAVDTMAEDAIRRVAAIVPPAFLVVTKSFEKHHADLVSLLQSMLPPKGKILLDTSWHEAELPSKSKKLVFFAPFGETTSRKHVITSTQVSQTKSYLQFQAVLPTQTLPMKTPLIGTYHASYLLPLVFLADYIGIPARTLQQTILSLRPLPHELISHKSRSGIMYIDDTSAFTNEKFTAVLTYARLFSKKRFLVLGVGDTAVSHKDMVSLGKQLGGVFGVILLVQSRWQKALRQGIKGSGKTSRVVCLGEKETLRFLEKNAGKGDLIVFEGEQARELAEKMITTTLTSA